MKRLLPPEIRQDWQVRVWHVVGGVSIRTKILGIVLAMVIVPGIVITLQVRTTLIRTLREQLQQQSVSVVRDVAARSTDLILINDLYALNQLLQDTLQNNRDIRYLFVMDPDEQVLAHTFEEGFPFDLLEANALSSDVSYHLQPLNTEEGLIGDAAVSVFEGRAGVARAGLSEQRLWRIVNATTVKLILSMLVVFFVGIGAASALTWLLTRPILTLAAATERVGRGDYSPHVPRWADDEVGDLAEAFNTMVVQLAQADAERAERERLRQFYLKRIIHAQEEERKRIARELHDETGQALASLMVGLRNVEDAHSPEETGHRLHNLREVLATTLERVRLLSLDLRPSVLDDLGLVAALGRFAQQYQERFGITAEVRTVELDDQRLSPEAEITIYRIVQEAMTNAAKHAACAHVSVLLQARKGYVSVIVEDDGCGFDVEKVFGEEAGQTRLGLYGMQERIELIGGQLDIESQPGGGCTIYLRVPLTQPETSNRHGGLVIPITPSYIAPKADS